jgi:dinuclear metal center YbgI/SA1388 family protein
MSDLVNLNELVRALDAELRTSDVPDYSTALNGLQLANAAGRVTRVAAAVDASTEVIREAVARGVDLLVVHHGLFWQGLQRLDGPQFVKIEHAIRNGLAIYSSHIPLDVHPEMGNNAQLAARLGLGGGRPFFPWKGIQLGLELEADIDRAELVQRVSVAVGGGPVHVTPGGPARVRRLGVITGGAGSEIASVAAQGVDTFLTGEGQHWTAPLAAELGVNLFYAGHYATETFGVKALCLWIQAHFGLGWEFIDRPSGL